MTRILLDTTPRGFDFKGEAAPLPPRVVVGDVQFRHPDPSRLFIGEQRLRDYLEANGLKHVLSMRELLSRVDMSALLKAYKPGGAPAFHPQVMLGLIVYGFTLGITSQRGLEALARRDLGAWWMGGGAHPDHSSFGKFINLHEATLTEEFFVTLTASLMKALPAPKNGAVAGDGTIVEAAASHFRTIKAEAARRRAQEAGAQASANPDDDKLAASAAAAEAVNAVVQDRQAQRDEKGRPGQAQVSPTEPDAVVQPRKDGAIRPAYKPSVLANSERMIVGQRLHASSETSAVLPMLEQHQQITGAPPERLNLDAGYHNGPLLRQLMEGNIDVLSPSGKAHGDDDMTRQPRDGKKLLKNVFRYDAERDLYICPQGKLLTPTKRNTDRHGQAFQIYGCGDCQGCPLREKCTDSDAGRTVRRYADDDVKEAMEEVLRQPAARAAYAKRQGMVEPVFAELRDTQHLKRFRHRGLKKVAAEFALHCMAYNLRRAVRLVALALVCWLMAVCQRLWRMRILGCTSRGGAPRAQHQPLQPALVAA